MRVVKQMGESITPWDYESQPLGRQYLLRRGSLGAKTKINRYNSEGFKTRASTSQKSRYGIRQVIKLQQRVPTQMFNIADWQSQVTPLGFFKNEMFLKIPNQFVTLPPKKQSDVRNKSSKNMPKYQENIQFNRQKIAFRNFKKQIENLDRLKASNKFNLQLKNPHKTKALIKISENHSSNSFAKPSLRNMNLFQEIKTEKAQKLQKKNKLSERSFKKTHILDTLLSKYQ